MEPNPDLVERFHRVLVEEIVQAAPRYLERPFTVAEIYQSLVPYRTHRDRLGVEMNGDYEDLLLRLLAGEGDFLILDSEPARRRIRKELERPNPNTGLYREFAAVEVRINPEAIPGDLPLSDETEASSGNGVSARPLARAGEPAEEAHSPVTSGGPTVPRDCPGCGVELPQRDSLRFCPACGSDVLVTECSSCGESLERSWRFCVACGTKTGR